MDSEILRKGQDDALDLLPQIHLALVPPSLQGQILCTPVDQSDKFELDKKKTRTRNSGVTANESK